MAGKHQIWSSNPRTKTRAKRSWRRREKQIGSRGRAIGKAGTFACHYQQADRTSKKKAKRGAWKNNRPPVSGSMLGDLLRDCGIVPELFKEPDNA